MASGRYTHEPSPQLPLEEGIAKKIPARSTRHLPAVQESMQDDSYDTFETRLALSRLLAIGSQIVTIPLEAATSVHQWIGATIDNCRRNGSWLKPLIFCLLFVICCLGVFLSAGIFQRSVSSYISNNGQAYDIQVGGKQANSWQHDPSANIVPQSGPYSVMGNPSITADFISQVLATYHSPAANKGQALHDLGIQYGIDPTFALAFFMHESSFGTQGEAAKSLSLGNLRCIPNFRCEDNFAQFDSWEDGFKAWYQLIRNLYVAQWQLMTVDQIIPKYAPTADNNNEQGYIASLKHAIDTWHAGQIVVRL